MIVVNIFFICHKSFKIRLWVNLCQISTFMSLECDSPSNQCLQLVFNSATQLNICTQVICKSNNGIWLFYGGNLTHWKFMRFFLLIFFVRHIFPRVKVNGCAQIFFKNKYFVLDLYLMQLQYSRSLYFHYYFYNCFMRKYLKVWCIFN